MSALGMTTIVKRTLEEIRPIVEAALKTQGFGVLTEIDVTATLREKIGVEFAPYRILGACNPHLAHRALTVDPEIGLLLPCNVTLRAVPGGTEVAIINPEAMLSMADERARRELGDLQSEAAAKLKAALVAIDAAARRVPAASP